MRFATLSILIAGAALLTGCAPAVSIHPLYTSQDLVADLPLAGTWAADDGEIWQIRKSGDAYDVTVLHTGDSPGTENFTVYLLRLKGTDFVDVTSKSSPGLVIAAHLFARVALQGNELCIALLDDDWLKKMIASGRAPQSISGEANTQIILTAPTADLQRFLVLHAADDDAWDADAGRFHRVD